MKKILIPLLVILGFGVTYAADKCTAAGKLADGSYCVSVGGHLLHARSFGLAPSSKVATVIFQPGGGNTMQTWNKVVPSVAKFAHVVTYDRSGFGKSQQYKPPKPLTAELVVNNLIQLLQQLKLPPPYILIGHSNGGLTMQYFALQHPKLVRGLILVDSSSMQLLNWSMFNPLKPDPKIGKAFYYEALGITPTLKSLQKIYNDKPAVAFGNLPLAVITATNHKKIRFFTSTKERDWQIYQNQLSKLSDNSYQIYAYNTGHFIQDEQPKLVIDVVYSMLQQIK